MIKINDNEFNVLTDYLHKYYGINLKHKRTLIEGRLNNYLMQKGYEDYSSYIKMLFEDHTGAEMSNVINYLTTNYTYFMREWDHFNFFKTRVLPEIKERIRDKDLRVWSAGCASGEEPFMLAMITDEVFSREKAMWDTKILATDISQKALKKAEKAVYSEEDLEKVPDSWKKKYFNKQDGNWHVKNNLKEEVIFRKFNLMEDFPFKKRFHVIFCRNVMIYFDVRTKKELVEKFYRVTEPGGYLIIGQSESIDRADTKYSYVMPSIFKKVGST